MKNKVIEVQNVQISISKQELDDYICITDIASEFASAINSVFKLYRIKEFQRLKE